MGDYRIHEWLQTSTLETVYGIQKRQSPRKWMNCCEGDKPLFFKSKPKAVAYMQGLVARDEKGQTDDN